MKSTWMLLAVLCVATGFAAPVRVESSAWRMWSQREATAPKTYIDPIVTRSGKGSLAVSGNSNIAVHGGWEQVVQDVKPLGWYRFTAYYKTQGVTDPVWQVLPRLDWRDTSGKRTGQPDFVHQTRVEGDWTKTWVEVQAPEKASAVALQLYLSHSPAGTVWFDDVTFEPTTAPKDRKIRVATINLRLRNTQSREENVEKFISTFESATTGNMDVILFPEGMTIVGNSKQGYVDIAEPVPGPTTKRLGELAKARNSWIIAGIYESEGPAVYNTAVLIDRQGRYAGKYRKVYLPREEYEKGLTPGNEFPVFDTDFGRIGLMICYDVFFTDPAKALANQGAEVILLPIWGGDETLAKARAIENRIFLVTSGYDHPTYIMDPDGERISEAKDVGQVAVANIDLNRRYSQQWLGDMRQRRAKEHRSDVKIPLPVRSVR